MWFFRKHPEFEVQLGEQVEKVKLVCKSPAHAKALHQFLTSLSEPAPQSPEPPKER